MTTRHPAPVAWQRCDCCEWCMPVPTPERCPRCTEPVRQHEPRDLQATWALLAASVIAMVPANVLPVMSTTQALRTSDHTLIGGIAELWTTGNWGLATIVFIASIAVPILKICALALLAWSVRFAPEWRRLERSRLYTLVEWVGHWSMLDVYVVVLLAGMMRFGGVAGAHAEPGLLAFGAVVVLTMLAAHSFDPRLIWQSRQAAVQPEPPNPLQGNVPPQAPTLNRDLG